MNNGHDKADEATIDGDARPDRGATFIELLVSIVLLGTIGVAVLVATTAALAGARTSDEIAKSQATVAEVADFLTDTDPENVTYRDCDSNTEASIRAQYQSQIDARFGVGVAQVVAPISFWDGTGFTGCDYNGGQRLQQVTLRSLVNSSERLVTVVKRPVSIPTADTVPAPTLPSYVGGSGQASVTLTDWMVNWP